MPAFLVVSASRVRRISSRTLWPSASAISAPCSAWWRFISPVAGDAAAAREARTYDAVVLRMLGATRWQLLAGQAIEYALLGSVLALLALALGLGGSWYVVTQLFDFPFAPDMVVVLTTLLVGLGMVVAIGLAGAWPILSVRPARALRQL